MVLFIDPPFVFVDLLLQLHNICFVLVEAHAKKDTLPELSLDVCHGFAGV